MTLLCTKKEDVQMLIEAHYHACVAKERDKAAGIIFDYKLYEELYKWGNYRTIVDLYIGVLPKDHFKDKPLLSKIDIHCDILGNLGNAYYTLDDVKKSIEYYGKALKIALEIGDRQSEGEWLGGLGNAYRT